jgi:hypothetical protein
MSRRCSEMCTRNDFLFREDMNYQDEPVWLESITSLQRAPVDLWLSEDRLTLSATDRIKKIGRSQPFVSAIGLQVW